MSKTIVVIGAGPEIGLAVARRFGKEGFNVALLARNESKLAGMVSEHTGIGITAAAFPADVMGTHGLGNALEKVIGHFGSIDVPEYGPVSAMDKMETVLETDQASAQYQFAYNVLGAITAV